ncbi:MAG: hypothetical protein JWP11_3413 [Frankiales bacterium]|nr:hypothetical protein [Frankiales bacterium]
MTGDADPRIALQQELRRRAMAVVTTLTLESADTFDQERPDTATALAMVQEVFDQGSVETQIGLVMALADVAAGAVNGWAAAAGATPDVVLQAMGLGIASHE